MTIHRPRRERRGDKQGAGVAPPIPGGVTVARIGFDHGWLCLPPTFLGLRVPVLLVDGRLLPDPELLGLKPFGSRDPHLPLPSTRIVVEHHPGAMISVWDHQPGGGPATLLGWHRAATSCGDIPWVQAGEGSTDTVVIIGDTHRIQLCWAAIWDSHIGRARLVDRTRHRTVTHGVPGTAQAAGASRSR